MQRKWIERLAEASANDEQGSALLAYLQEPMATYMTGARQVSGLLWNNQELCSFLDGFGLEGNPAKMSYGSFLHTFFKWDGDKDWEELAYSLLFYGFIEPLSMIDQADRTDCVCLPHEERKV